MPQAIAITIFVEYFVPQAIAITIFVEYFVPQAIATTIFVGDFVPQAIATDIFVEYFVPLASHPRQIAEEFDEFGSQAIEKQSIGTQIALQNSTKNLGGLRNQVILRELRTPGSQNTIFIDKINPPTPFEHGRVQGAKLRRTTRTLGRRLDREN